MILRIPRLELGEPAERTTAIDRLNQLWRMEDSRENRENEQKREEIGRLDM